MNPPPAAPLAYASPTSAGGFLLERRPDGGVFAQIPPPPRWARLVPAAAWFLVASVVLTFLLAVLVQALATDSYPGTLRARVGFVAFTAVNSALWGIALSRLWRVARHRQQPVAVLSAGDDGLTVTLDESPTHPSSWPRDRIVNVRLVVAATSRLDGDRVCVCVELLDGFTATVCVRTAGSAGWLGPLEAELRRAMGLPPEP